MNIFEVLENGVSVYADVDTGTIITWDGENNFSVFGQSENDEFEEVDENKDKGK